MNLTLMKRSNTVNLSWRRLKRINGGNKIKSTLTLFMAILVLCSNGMVWGNDSNEDSPKITVAAIQFTPSQIVKENTDKILGFLEQCAEKKVRVAAFQECAVTGYYKELIPQVPQNELDEAEQCIADACKRLDIYAIVGTPHHKGGVIYNTAVVFNPDGKEIERYAKMQLVGGDDWAVPGETLSVFKIDDIPCSIIICHDERYPELVRLPVLAGARLIFYVSSESSVTAEGKLEPYRAQICARADENDVFIVHANSPAMLSHGQSRIVGPGGNLIAEASMFKDQIITATLNMKSASGSTAKNSLRNPLLKSWWEEGIGKVIIRD